ncbi:hypothetical protein V6N12_019232 [Hibiscus sabdariffa]|uniref:Uncharacterized protein n=1 Tax=Hibiscus sabdariffa TaxID=183260 RepID=A0ABR2C6Y9_9ROSI
MVGPSSPSQGKDQNSQQIHGAQPCTTNPGSRGHSGRRVPCIAQNNKAKEADGTYQSYAYRIRRKRGGTSHKNIATRATQYGDKPPQRGKPRLHPGHRQRHKVAWERARGSCLKTLERNATREPAMETKARNPPYQLATTQPASSTQRTDQGLPSSHSRTAHTTRPRSM